MMLSQKRTKIVCTIGPASRDVATLYRLGQAGMDVARLNFSHGTYAEHEKILKHIHLAERRLGSSFGILQDLQGPKIRVGVLPKEGIQLTTGKRVVFSTSSSVAAGEIPLPFASLPRDVKRGQRLLLDDGLLEVGVERVEGQRIVTEVIHGGTLTSHKGINLPETHLRIPALSDKDRADAAFGLKMGVDFIALSFVRSPEDVKELRAFLQKRRKKTLPKIVVKIEKREAVERFEEILPLVDAVMVARGDLGVEMPAAEVPVIQKQIVAACRSASVPVIVATQMLDSMIRNPRPTRAEVSDIANAVADHADAVMLSGETANGAYPVEAVKMMAESIRAVEDSDLDNLNPVDVSGPRDVPEVIGATVRVIVEALQNPPILVATASGRTAQEISAFRPESPLFAFTFDPHVHRMLRLVWGVEAFLLPRKKTPDLMIKAGMELLRRQKKIKAGQRVVIVTGDASGKPGTANKVEIGRV